MKITQVLFVSMIFPAPFWYPPLASFLPRAFFPHPKSVMFVEIALKVFGLIYSHCHLQFEAIRVKCPYILHRTFPQFNMFFFAYNITSPLDAGLQ